MSTQKAHLIGIFETKAQALSFLVFVGLYFPCVSTIAVLKSIVGSYKAYGIVVWSVFVAYLIAWIFYDLMHHFEHVLYAGVFFLGYILFNFIKHKRLLMRSI
jgi:ferrous iron transport protein B